MSSARRPPNPLKDLLEEAETDLSRHLREACDAEARGVASESAEEIRRLEDALLSAAMAASQVLKARSHLGDDAAPASEPATESARHADIGLRPSPPAPTPASRSAPSTQAPSPAAEQAGRAAPQADRAPEPATICEPVSTITLVREFVDETGRTWRAWPVTPGLARQREGGARRILGDFQEGWICFEALDNSGRRRLQRREPRWSELPDDELQRLLAQAIDARRKPRQPTGTVSPDPRDVH
jgi:hypothetical protein